MKFLCPPSMQPHAAKVLAGEYDIPGLEFPKPPRVLDIGANVGAFAVWASRRWPGCELTCYEPHPGNYALLKQNVPGARHRATAVVGLGHPGTMRLYDGANNCGEASLFHGEEQSDSIHEVATVDAFALDDCDVLKVDAEGCEYEILRRYFRPTGRPGPRAVVYEWHSADDRWRCGGIMASSGYECVEDTINRPDRGIMKWLRKAGPCASDK